MCGFVLFWSGFFKVFFLLQNASTIDEWYLRKLSRIMTERAKSQSIASSMFFFTFINFIHSSFFFKDFKTG
jgi:hypothetical protein